MNSLHASLEFLTCWEKIKWVAIPYHQGKAISRSQFGNELEILNYTIRMHQEMGLDIGIVKEEIQRVRAAYRRALESTDKKARENILKYVNQLRGSNSNIDILDVKEEEYAIIKSNIDKNVDMQLEIIRRLVVPQIMIHSIQLNSDSQLYGAIFNKVSGFSGTLWSAQTFPRIFLDPEISDTAERTLTLLVQYSMETPAIQKIPVLPEKQFEAQNPKEVLASLFANSKIGAHSVIDMGGLFKNYTNRSVAEAILLTGVKGVVYYEEDREWFLEATGSTPLEGRKLDLSTIGVFWDQKHTTGSDITVDYNAAAIVTFAKQNIMRDVLQSIWRLRKFEESQRVEFVIGEEDALFIKRQLKEGANQSIQNLTLENLLLYALSILV